MIKRLIFSIAILLVLAGCASHFLEQRKLSRPIVQLAMGKVQENDIQGSLIELRKAMTANPSDPEVYYGFALAYWKSGKPEKALENADKAIEYGDKLAIEHPSIRSEAYNLKGSILAGQGKYADSVACFNKALADEIYQTPEYALHNLANIYLQMKNIPLAYEKAHKALDANSHYAPAWEVLSRIYVAQGRPNDAVDALKHAVLEFPSYTEAHWELAQLYLQMGNQETAREHLLKVIQLEPESLYGTLAEERLRGMK